MDFTRHVSPATGDRHNVSTHNARRVAVLTIAACLVAAGMSGCSRAATPSAQPATTPVSTTSTTPMEYTSVTDGAGQRVTIDQAPPRTGPIVANAKAGTPIVMEFRGTAAGCRKTVVFKRFGINQDVTNGGVVKLPALQAGTYPWVCQMGMPFGTLVVR